MTLPITNGDIRDMISLGEDVAAGKVAPSAFVVRWPDVARREDKDVTELWFSVSYFESDISGGLESAEFYRQAILKYASRLRARFQISRTESKKA